MNAQILVASMTGHSRKIAMEIAAQTGLPVYDLKNTHQLPSCELLFIVSGIYGGESKAELLDFARSLTPEQIPRAALVSSSTRNFAQGNLRKTLEEAGIQVEKEEYHCQGAFFLAALGHPSAAERQGAADFVKKLLRT